ncbi:hypothetical protein BAPA111461_12255 [Bacillus paramycoides]
MIGILAGMGPKSTGPFVDTVVAHCQTSLLMRISSTNITEKVS